MLIMTRKQGDAVVIPELGITVRILDIRGESVRIGVQAPTDMAVHRHEVWERIRRERQEATS